LSYPSPVPAGEDSGLIFQHPFTGNDLHQNYFNHLADFPEMASSFSCRNWLSLSRFHGFEFRASLEPDANGCAKAKNSFRIQLLAFGLERLAFSLALAGHLLTLHCEGSFHENHNLVWFVRRPWREFHFRPCR
jgi:hypothetical protein